MPEKPGDKTQPSYQCAVKNTVINVYKSKKKTTVLLLHISQGADRKLCPVKIA